MSLVVIIILFVVRLPLIIIAGIAVLLIALSVNQHFALFASDYEVLKSTQSLAGWAPYVLTGVVILFALGFIFLLKKSSPQQAAVLTQNFSPPAFSAASSSLNKSPIGNSALVSALNRAI